jgi:hypothetical protein
MTQGVAELEKNNFLRMAMVAAISKGDIDMLNVILVETGASVDNTAITS